MDSDSELLAYAGFPKDGLCYWLQWLDRVSLNTQSGSPMVTAYLAQVPDSPAPGKAVTIAQALDFRKGRVANAQVAAGSLPALRPGMIFCDGLHVGELKMDAFGEQAMGPSEGADLVSADDLVDAPHWASSPWKVLPSSLYPLRTKRSPFLLRYRRDDVELLIPASEVFRSFCAPETPLANLILAGEWKTVIDRLFNEAYCNQASDEWQIGLRKGLTGKSALTLASYRWTDAGTTTRKLLRSGFHNEDYRLRATIPFAFDGISFSGEGLALTTRENTKRFLLLRISGVSVSALRELTAPIVYRLDNYSTQHTVGDDMGKEPPIHQSVPASGPPGSPATKLINTDPPASTSIVKRVAVEAPLMGGFPEVRRRPLDPPIPPDRKRRRHMLMAEPTSEGSTALPRRGQRPVMAVSHDQEVRPSLGFDAVSDVLDRLLASGDIDSWITVIPEDWPWRTVGGVEAWEFPSEIDARRTKFSFLMTESRKDAQGRLISPRQYTHRRTCLVVEIEIRGGLVYWLEIERRSKSEGFCYLLVRVEPSQIEELSKQLLRSAAASRGVWAGSDAQEAAYKMLRVRHVYDDNKGIKINAVRSALRRIAS